MSGFTFPEPTYGQVEDTAVRCVGWKLPVKEILSHTPGRMKKVFLYQTEVFIMWIRQWEIIRRVKCDNAPWFCATPYLCLLKGVGYIEL